MKWNSNLNRTLSEYLCWYLLLAYYLVVPTPDFRSSAKIFHYPTVPGTSICRETNCLNSKSPTQEFYFRAVWPFEQSTCPEIRSVSSKTEFLKILSTSKSSTWVETVWRICPKICLKIYRNFKALFCPKIVSGLFKRSGSNLWPTFIAWICPTIR